jgi:transcriptional regulator with XRE-family HTH domain
MEKIINNWYATSDVAILKVLGSFIQKTRLQQNKTQQEIAVASGINRSTLVQIEKGNGGNLLSYIQVLRALQQLHLLQGFEIKQQISPLQLAKIEAKQRQRARNNNQKINVNKPKTAW